MTEVHLMQPIKKIYAYFDTPALEDVLNNTRHKLKLDKDEDFSFVCVSLLIYSKEKIVNGTIAFYDNLFAGEIYGEIGHQRTLWMSFVKKEKVNIIEHSNEQYSTTAYKKMDPLFNEKTKIYNEMKTGKTPVDPKVKDKIGKYVVVDSNCPYLPHPNNELWMYNSYPLYGDPSMDSKFKEKVKSEYDRNKKNYEEAVDALDLDGKFIKTFTSMHKASQEYSIDSGISCTEIFECCIGKRKTAGKFKWKFKEVIYAA